MAELTYEEAAIKLGVKVSSVYTAVARGKLHPFRKVGTKVNVLDEKEVIAYGQRDRESLASMHKEKSPATAKHVSIHQQDGVDIEAIKQEVKEEIYKDMGSFGDFLKAFSQRPLAVR